ncbi:MAG: DMT family transporter [Anaerolineae bacterium]
MFIATDHVQGNTMRTLTAPLSANRTALGILSGLAAASIWGAMYVVSKVVLDVIPPFTLIFTRLVLGGLALWLLLALRGGLHVSARQFWQVFAVGLVGYGVSLGFQFIGTKLSTAANGSLVTSATPAFILLFASLILKERITPRRLIALLISTLGVVAVIDPRSARLEPGLFLGNLSLLAAALTWALYSVLIRLVTRQLDVLTVSLIAFMGGLPVVIPAGLWETSTQGIGQITPGIVAGVLFLGIICTALAMALWNNSFAALDASVASLTFFAQPVVGSLLGWFFLKESITPLFILGGLLIAAGLVVASRETAS